MHLYVVRHPERDRLRRHLLERGIQTDIHYSHSTSLATGLIVQLGFRKGDLLISEKIHREVLSLPIIPTSTREEIEIVCAAVREACRLI